MTEDQIIRDAQYRKGLSIAFFNATNAAISLVSSGNIPEDKVLDEVCKIRDFFLDQHKTYYTNVIANVGKNYDSQQTIEKLRSTKTLDELRTMWVTLSEDERRDGDVREVANTLKSQYDKA